MTKQSKRTCAIGVLCVIALACDPVGNINLDNASFGIPGCGEANSASCQEVSLTERGVPVLLLGDTAGFSAYTGGGYTDIEWEHSTPALSFVGPPVLVSALFKSMSHVVVKGDAVGVSTVTARRKSYSASRTVEVVPASALRELTITRVRCTGLAAGLCEPGSSVPVFDDVLRAGDSVRVQGAISDVSFRPVTATVMWSTSDAGIAITALALGFPDRATVVVATGVGDAVITAEVGGLTSSFVLHVVK